MYSFNREFKIQKTNLICWTKPTKSGYSWVIKRIGSSFLDIALKMFGICSLVRWLFVHIKFYPGFGSRTREQSHERSLSCFDRYVTKICPKIFPKNYKTVSGIQLPMKLMTPLLYLVKSFFFKMTFSVFVCFNSTGWFH